jgi:hypothetical protein
MTKQLERRLKELQEEFETGQRLLAEYESKQANLRSSLLRISGAIQVLEELLNQECAVDDVIAPKKNGAATESTLGDV